MSDLFPLARFSVDVCGGYVLFCVQLSCHFHVHSSVSLLGLWIDCCCCHGDVMSCLTGIIMCWHLCWLSWWLVVYFADQSGSSLVLRHCPFIGGCSLPWEQ